MKKIPLLVNFLFFSFLSFAQLNPVSWTFSAEKITDTEYNVYLVASVDDDWFIYSQYLESDDGPIRTTFSFDKSPDVKLIGKTKEDGKKKEGYDALFDMNVVKFGGKVTFTQKVAVKAGAEKVSGWLEFMTCDDGRCLPPKEVTFDIKL